MPSIPSLHRGSRELDGTHELGSDPSGSDPGRVARSAAEQSQRSGARHHHDRGRDGDPPGARAPIPSRAARGPGEDALDQLALAPGTEARDVAERATCLAEEVLDRLARSPGGPGFSHVQATPSRWSFSCQALRSRRTAWNMRDFTVPTGIDKRTPISG